jgi:hypothetical protein
LTPVKDRSKEIRHSKALKSNGYGVIMINSFSIISG